MNAILRRASLRLLAGACALLSFAHASAAPAACTYTPIGKLPLRYSGPGLAITTEGSINGTRPSCWWTPAPTRPP